MTTYYQLKCETCNAVFQPLVATSEDELLRPDWDEIRDLIGRTIADLMEIFYNSHSMHGLICVEV
jgi:hypothetical protein